MAGSRDGTTFELIGVVGLRDPPRPGTMDLIGAIRQRGISIKMLTGDSLPIAREIAAELGVGTNIVRSSKLKELLSSDPVSAAELAEKSDGFAEIYPEDKYTVVKALQGRDHVTGMTGDGVNDAPALKQAEVGIAVSNATDVAKGAASVVLTTEGLSEILDLVTVGRTIYQRVETWVMNKIVKTFEIGVFVTLAFLITGTYVLSALDIVLFLFLIDFVTISISTDTEEGSRLPEKWNVPGLFRFGVALGIFTLTELFALYLIGQIVFDISTNNAVLNTFFFTAIMFFGLLTPLILRTNGNFWSTKPGKTLLTAIIVDMALVGALALGGFGLVTPISFPEFLLVVAYSLSTALILNNFIKNLLGKFGLRRL
ncbi:MAG: HAD-IC family P-type ATPase [Thermoplasmataceae archaeon]